MKKLLLALLLAGTSATVFAQGTLNFSTLLTATSTGTNRTTSTGVQAPALGARASGAAFLGQLYMAAGVVADATLLQTNATAGPAPFNTGGQAGYITGGVLTLTGLGAGTITVQLRAWNSAFTSWEAAPVAERTALTGPGAPNVFQISLTVPPATPATLAGLQGFDIGGVPEPSSIALGLLGLGAVALFRRRK